MARKKTGKPKQPQGGRRPAQPAQQPRQGKRQSVSKKPRTVPAGPQPSAADQKKQAKAKQKRAKQLEKQRAKAEAAARKNEAAKKKRKSISGTKAAKAARKKPEEQRKTVSKPDETQTDAPTEQTERAKKSGRRIGDIRARERAERNRSRYRRYILRIVIALVVVLAVIFGAIFAYRSDLLHVNQVQVTGASHLTNEEITSIAAVPDDSTLLRLDDDGIIERLKSNAWVEDVSVGRKFPDTIELKIVERSPGAVVRLSEKNIWVVSDDGYWLSAANSDDWKKAMHIIDVNPAIAAPIAGGDCNDGGIKNALEILHGISDDLKADIESISAESSIKTALNLKGGVTVAFGDSSDIEMKEAAISALLEQYEGTISYINVRVPTRPTFRTLD